MPERCTNIEALLGIDHEILPTEFAAPRPTIVKKHAPVAMSPGRRHCSVFPLALETQAGQICESIEVPKLTGSRATLQ